MIIIMIGTGFKVDTSIDISYLELGVLLTIITAIETEFKMDTTIVNNYLVQNTLNLISNKFFN